MSAPAENAPRIMSPASFVLTLVIAVAAIMGIFVVVLYMTSRLSSSGSSPVNPTATSPASADTQAHAQNGTVKPEGDATGTVFYPVPYASPPHLTVAPGSRYVILRQDEFGFTWFDRARVKDGMLIAAIPELAEFAPKSGEPQKFDTQQPELTWDAKGLRASASTPPLKSFEQTGSFESDFGQQGQVNFPIPYASPPNVELTGNHTKTVIVECTPIGFKWKNNSKGEYSREYGTVTWKSKGIRATQIPKS